MADFKSKERTMVISTTSEKKIQESERLKALYQLALELTALQKLDSVLNTALHHCLQLTDSQFGFRGRGISYQPPSLMLNS
jgi:hypothetical protein